MAPQPIPEPQDRQHGQQDDRKPVPDPLRDEHGNIKVKPTDNHDRDEQGTILAKPIPPSDLPGAEVDQGEAPYEEPPPPIEVPQEVASA